jgi:2-keto-3-deoxy-L-fuconate dehydrogenase
VEFHYNFIKFLNNMFSLKGKTAVITGGGSGIGKGIALVFAAQGANVQIVELNQDAGHAVVKRSQIMVE